MVKEFLFIQLIHTSEYTVLVLVGPFILGPEMMLEIAACIELGQLVETEKL